MDGVSNTKLNDMKDLFWHSSTWTMERIRLDSIWRQLYLRGDNLPLPNFILFYQSFMQLMSFGFGLGFKGTWDHAHSSVLWELECTAVDLIPFLSLSCLIYVWIFLGSYCLLLGDFISFMCFEVTVFVFVEELLV